MPNVEDDTLMAVSDVTAKASSVDTRVHVTMSRLLAQKAYADGFRLTPRAAINNAYAGSHRSGLRGRGLNFEELGHYRVGDDVRMMDWKVSNRTGKPHVRVFTEEKERPVLIVVDQRQSMFFGSQYLLKSVLAAEAAALFAWQEMAQGDSVGAVLFNDRDMLEFRPTRNNKTLLSVFHALVDLNNKLSAKGDSSTKPSEQMNHAFKVLARLCSHDALVIFLSDFSGFDDKCAVHVKNIAQRNKIILAQISDPLEQSISLGDDLLVGNAQSQASINLSEQVRLKFSNSWKTQQDFLESSTRHNNITHISLNAAKETAQQLQQALNEPRSGLS